MIRPKPLLGAAALLILVGAGAYWTTRRTPGSPPQEEMLLPFRTEAVGVGRLLELQPPPMPLRSVRWAGPLPGGLAVAQVLTQTGRQQAVLFMEGQPAGLGSFEPPAGVASTFFSFAELVDAAVLPGQTAILFYRGAGADEPGLVLAWDLASGGVQWSQRAQGEHLALSPEGRSAFLYGMRSGVTRFDLGGARVKAPASLAWPAELGPVSGLLPTGPRAFLVAHGGGLSAWRDGAWTHRSAPTPSPLGFTPASGRLAGGPKGGWWQPEPGQLLPLGPDGTPGEPKDLKALLPAEAALDAALLQLLGTDPEGQLWFALARPSLPQAAAAPPAPVPAEGAEVPALPAPAEPVPGLDPTSREAWEVHLAKGLDRLYRWKPGSAAMKAVDWSRWKAFAPPQGLARPTGDAGLRPEAGGFLLGTPERMWWLPLAALQPR